MYYEYEGVLKVISRSRATLIFFMGVPIVKPSSYVYRDHVYRGQGQSFGILLPNIFGLYITV